MFCQNTPCAVWHFSIYSLHSMSTLPTELVSLFGSSLFGSVIRLFSLSLISRHRERLIKLCKNKVAFNNIELARKCQHPGLQITRRAIALLAVFSIILLPKLIAIFKPEIPIAVGYSQIKDGFLFFSSAYEKIHWSQFHGLVITPLDTHLLSAIVGLYFGSALVDFKA